MDSTAFVNNAATTARVRMRKLGAEKVNPYYLNIFK